MKIKTASYQELFNRMWDGLAGQGWKRSVDENDLCAYRGEEGMKCAIGYCIDDEAAKEWEGDSISAADIKYRLHIKVDRLEFLTDCQRAHDGGLDHEMKKRFRAIAKKYNLTIPGE